MKHGPDIARTAALIGDPARANMLTALMSGKALTAGELASQAGVTLPTASAHLSKLTDGGLVTPRKQGRHKYFTLAGPDVAHVLEGLMGLAADSGHLRTRPGPRDPALRKARACYDHLAGDLGTQLFDAWCARGYLIATEEDVTLTDAGAAAMQAFGIDLTTLYTSRTPLCRPCLDWSERRMHLAGSLGRAVLSRIEALGWAKRDRATRIVAFTPQGEQAFRGLIA